MVIIHISNLDILVLNMLLNNGHYSMVSKRRLQSMLGPMVSQTLKQLILNQHQNPTHLPMRVFRCQSDIIPDFSFRIRGIFRFMLNNRLLQNLVVEADWIFACQRVV